MNKEEQVMSGLWEVFNKRIMLDGFQMKKSLREYNPSEIHCIEYIAKNIEPNVTKLAEAFYMTRSAISKLTKKLIAKGLAENYQKPENKKEIYFRLTNSGEAVFRIHERLHNDFTARDKSLFDKITDTEFDVIIRFAELYNAHLDFEIKKLGIDTRAEGNDKL